jgi:guanylate kinase
MSPESKFDLPHADPLLIVISGPSGAGKDSVIQRMKERGLPFEFVVTATTRPRRDHEVHGRDYWFVPREVFDRMIKDDELIEHAIVYNDYKGIPKQGVRDALATGKDVILRVDVQGAETIRKLIPDALLIFVTAETEQDLVHRLETRHTETTKEFELRIATACQELQHIGIFDYVVINRDLYLDEAVDVIRSIIDAEHHRVTPRKVSL